jgi:hypothetical protein
MLRANPTDHQKLADDLIWGVDGPNGIAAYLGIKPRKAYYLIAKGVIPVDRKGHRTLTARRSRLDATFAGGTSA